MKLVKESPFSNQYGTLELREDENGNKFLEMDDCYGNDVFGPLTENQVKAFYLLCEVERK